MFCFFSRWCHSSSANISPNKLGQSFLARASMILSFFFKKHVPEAFGKSTGHSERRTASSKRGKKERKYIDINMYMFRQYVYGQRSPPSVDRRLGTFFFFLLSSFFCKTDFSPLCLLPTGQNLSPFDSTERSQQRIGRCRHVAYHPALSMSTGRRELYCTTVITNFTNYISCGY